MGRRAHAHRVGATARLARIRRSSWAPIAILIAVGVVFGVLVVVVVRATGSLIHDEIISHLVATGHLDDWQRVIEGGRPAGMWTSGADLHHFLQRDSHSTLAAVDQNLSDLDLHPPLFFWALLGVRSLGVGIIPSGPVLNITIVLLAGVVLYVLLVDVLEDRFLAALGVAVFAFSAALVRSTANTRQYPMQMLAAVILIWIVARLFERPRSPWLLFSLLVTGALGLLTATPFVFALAGAVLVTAVWWGRRNLRATASVVMAAAASGLIALAIHPGYFDQYSRSQYQNTFNPAMSLRGRLQAWVDGFFDLVTLDHAVRSLFEGAALVGVLVLLATAFWWCPPAARVLRRQPVCAAALGVAGTALVGATAAYLLHRSPSHAVGWQYVTLFWPGVVLLGAAVVKHNFRRPALALLVVAALLLTFTLRWEHGYSGFFASQRRAVNEVSGATLVIADCLERGSTPGAALWVPSDAKFLLLTRSQTRPPSVPAGADRSKAFLLHSDACTPGNRIDQRLAELGLRRGAPIGPIGQVNVYPLEARTEASATPGSDTPSQGHAIGVARPSTAAGG